MLGEPATLRGPPSAHSARPDVPVVDTTGDSAVLPEFKTSLSKPTGVLAVHLKKVKTLNDEFMSCFDCDEISLYVRVIVGSSVKCSCIHETSTVPDTLILDDLRHFHLQLSPRRNDGNNKVRLELIGFDRRDVHRVISRKAIHMYEIVKNLYMVETYRFMRSEKVIAELEVEFCFAYGAFGYGHSNQLENRKADPQEQVMHTMFCRFAPPPDRQRAEIAPDVMTCLPVGQPAFINFTERPEFGNLRAEFESEADHHNVRQIEEPMLLITRMRKRMHTLQNTYERQGSRKARLAFLRRLIRSDHLALDNSDEFAAPEHLRLRRRSGTTVGAEVGNLSYLTPGTSRKMALSGVDTHPPTDRHEMDDDHADLPIADLAKIMEVAPGVIQSRMAKNPGGTQQFPPTLFLPPIGAPSVSEQEEQIEMTQVSPTEMPEETDKSSEIQASDPEVEQKKRGATRWRVFGWLFSNKQGLVPQDNAPIAGGPISVISAELATERDVNQIRIREAAAPARTPAESPAVPAGDRRWSRKFSLFGGRSSKQQGPSSAPTEPTPSSRRTSWFGSKVAPAPTPDGATVQPPPSGRKMSILENAQNLLHKITGSGPQKTGVRPDLVCPRVMVMPPTPCASDDDDDDSDTDVPTTVVTDVDVGTLGMTSDA